MKCEVYGLCSFLLQQFRSTQTNCLGLQKAIHRYRQQIVEYGIQIKISMDYVVFEQLDALFVELLELGISASKKCVDNRYIHFKSYKSHSVVLQMECSGCLDASGIVCDRAKVFCEVDKGVSKLTIVFNGECL